VTGTEKIADMLTADCRGVADIFASDKIEKKAQV